MIRFNYYSNEMLDLPANVHCKGDVNVPGPSAQETALQEQQLQFSLLLMVVAVRWIFLLL